MAANMGEIEKNIPYWLKFDWSMEAQNRIYRYWAIYYSNWNRVDIAMPYFNMALDLNPNDYQTLYRRSMTFRKAAKLEAAHSDAVAASDMANAVLRPSSLIDSQVCDALFELNKLESAKLELNNSMRKFKGVKAQAFADRLIVVDDIIKDNTGKALNSFYLKQQKLVKEVKDLMNAKEIVDPRPKWKILRDEKKCDVLSKTEVDKVILSPLEIARRNRSFNLLHQTYAKNCWTDIIFMKNLRNDPSLQLGKCFSSSEFLQTLSDEQYQIVRLFMRMLQARSPMYYVAYSNAKTSEKRKQAYLFRIQYQTQRNMIRDLRHIRQLRERKDIQSLSNYVEKVMGDYYVTKTHRVMCWKFEFLTEVYNTLALALAETYLVPKKFVRSANAMRNLLALQNDKVKDVVPFVFGNRATYQKGQFIDPVATRARKLITRLEKRLLHATYSIEKCYLHHQIADVHLRQGHLDECRFIARKAIQESNNCNSLIWKFLCIIIMIKANVVQHKIEATLDALQMAQPVVKRLESTQLITFIDTCIACNEEDYNNKKLTINRNASKTSLSSTVTNYRLSSVSSTKIE